jgi:hypothetical protein
MMDGREIWGISGNFGISKQKDCSFFHLWAFVRPELNYNRDGNSDFHDRGGRTATR